jgi:hypothetical protein
MQEQADRAAEQKLAESAANEPYDLISRRVSLRRSADRRCSNTTCCDSATNNPTKNKLLTHWENSCIIQFLTQQKAHTMQFSPSTQKQARELLNYIDSHSAAIARRRKNTAYLAAVQAVRDRLIESYASRPAGPGPCRWREIGVYAVCDTIAEQYSVPIYDVVGDAHPDADRITSI